MSDKNTLRPPSAPLRKPEWMKVRLRSADRYHDTSSIIVEGGLHTICSSGRCPNQSECWSRGTATFMIGGALCTRACRFCATGFSKTPPPLDPKEPRRLAVSIAAMNLKYAVITSVDRDDLSDLGAHHWRECILAVRKKSPETKIEVLIPDFQGDLDLLHVVLESAPDVVGHNLETVRRLTPRVRHRATYETSMKVLREIAKAGFPTKSGIMLGLGETQEEVEELMRECVDSGVSLLTIGQYLRPTSRHLPVVEYIHPDVFAHYKRVGEEYGLTHVESGPLVRSSYHAESQIQKVKKKLENI